MFWTRVASGAVLLVILASMFIIGGNVLLTFLGVISIIGLYEFYRATGLCEKNGPINQLTIFGYIGAIALYIMMFVTGGNLQYVIFVPVLSFVFIFGIFVLTFPKYDSTKATYAFTGVCYVPLMLVFVYLTRQLDGGIYLVWLVFMASWICDTFAYFTGMLFGKHKLAPVLSPKKSIEGAIGGTLFAGIFGGVYGYFISGYIADGSKAIIACAVISAAGAVVSQIGDLAASAVKRNFEIKDYGHLIPGHGGILDRFDSVIFAAPMVYIVAVLFLT